MGVVQTSKIPPSFDKRLLKVIKDEEISKIQELIIELNTIFPVDSCLTFAQYSEIFGSFFQELQQEFFKKIANPERNVIDRFEICCVLILLCSADFDAKIANLFKLFDFNSNGDLEFSEILITAQSIIRGLCKFCSLKPPTLTEITTACQSIIKDMDINQDREVVIKEVLYWCNNNRHMQEFLLRFAGIQTFPNCKRRFRETFSKLEFIFKAAGKKDSEAVHIDSLTSVLMMDMPELEEEDINTLKELLLGTTQELFPEGKPMMIYKDVFNAVARAWAAFSATDINNDNKISKTELCFLLYCTEPYEDETYPSKERISYEWKNIDKDRSKSITRKEWLDYLSIDQKNKGVRIFRENLRKTFQEHDQDKSGALSFKELRNLLAANLKVIEAKVKIKGGEEWKNFDKIIEDYALDLFAVFKKDKKIGCISWLDFKTYYTLCLEKQRILEEFIRKYF